MYNARTTFNQHRRRLETMDHQQQHETTPLLPWGDINVVIVTDVHSWIGGHSRHAQALLTSSNQSNFLRIPNVATSATAPLLNVDYGHVLSFVQRLQEYATVMNENLFFVMNGDFIDGTGLTEFPPIHLTSLLQEFMPWDAINIGNHELYRNSTVEHLHDILEQPSLLLSSSSSSKVPFSWKERYITSNVIFSDTQRPLGNRFIYLHGPSATVLTFGFLYNFQQGCRAAMVEAVEEVVQSEWFVNVLTVNNNNNNVNNNINQTTNNTHHDTVYQDFDAILILAHMGYNDPLIVNVLLPAMRKLVGLDMPIQFVTGHSHIRAFFVLDDMSTTLEAGHYLDTIGFCSFPTRQSGRRQRRRNERNERNALEEEEYHSTTTITHSINSTNDLFRHVLLDANQETLRSIMQVPQLDTLDGKAFSARIRQTQQDVGLLKPIGCSPTNYYLDYGLDHAQSLWRLYITQVIPSTLFSTTTRKSQSASTSSSPPRAVFVQATDGLRFDLFQGQVLVDDAIAVSPFQDVIYQVVEQVLGDALLEILEHKAGTVTNATIVTDDTFVPPLPEYAYAMDGDEPRVIETDRLYEVMTVELDLGYFISRVETVTGVTPSPKPVQAAQGNGMTSTQLWLDFVKLRWSLTSAADCDATAMGSQKMPVLETGSTSWYVAAFAGAAVTFVLFILARKGYAALRRTAQGYKAATDQATAESELELSE